MFRHLLWSAVQKDQLRQHEHYLSQIDSDLAEHTRLPPERGEKPHIIQSYVEKETYLRFEVSHDWLLFFSLKFFLKIMIVARVTCCVV